MVLPLPSRLAEWTDVTLIASEHFVSLFYTFLSNPALREAACVCVDEVRQSTRPCRPVPGLAGVGAGAACTGADRSWRAPRVGTERSLCYRLCSRGCAQAAKWR